jgi:hypothetical protein
MREVTVALEALRQRLRRNCLTWLTRPRPAVVVVAIVIVVVAVVIAPDDPCVDEDAEREDRGNSRHDT